MKNFHFIQEGFVSMIEVSKVLKFSKILSFPKDTFQIALCTIQNLSVLNSIFHFFNSLMVFSKS